MHVITGQIRKDVFTKEGSNNNGPWKMYAVELSESFKNKDGEKQYTNYRATFFAKQNQISYYDDWIQKGSVISVTAETLEIQQREHNGNNYVTLNLNNPRLAFFQSSGGQQSSGQQQQSGGWGAPIQPAQKQQTQQKPQRSRNEPPMDFDSDIPF